MTFTIRVYNKNNYIEYDESDSRSYNIIAVGIKNISSKHNFSLICDLISGYNYKFFTKLLEETDQWALKDSELLCEKNDYKVICNLTDKTLILNDINGVDVIYNYAGKGLEKKITTVVKYISPLILVYSSDEYYDIPCINLNHSLDSSIISVFKKIKKETKIVGLPVKFCSSCNLYLLDNDFYRSFKKYTYPYDVLKVVGIKRKNQNTTKKNERHEYPVEHEEYYEYNSNGEK